MSVKLYVGNLPFSMTENDLTDLFAQAGNVARVQMINDRVTGRPRGFGFVEMGTAEEAQAAIAKFHGQEINGRALTVNEARPMEQREGGGGGGGYRGGGGGGRGGARGDRRGVREQHQTDVSGRSVPVGGGHVPGFVAAYRHRLRRPRPGGRAADGAVRRDGAA